MRNDIDRFAARIWCLRIDMMQTLAAKEGREMNPLHTRDLRDQPMHVQEMWRDIAEELFREYDIQRKGKAVPQAPPKLDEKPPIGRTDGQWFHVEAWAWIPDDRIDEAVNGLIADSGKALAAQTGAKYIDDIGLFALERPVVSQRRNLVQRFGDWLAAR